MTNRRKMEVMKRVLAVLFLVSTVSTVPACGGWCARDTILETTFAAEQVVDAVQTEKGIRYDAEMNPVIGSHGQGVTPIVYFPATTILHVIVSGLLPRGAARTIWQGVTIGAEADNVITNVGQVEQLR